MACRKAGLHPEPRRACAGSARPARRCRADGFRWVHDERRACPCSRPSAAAPTSAPPSSARRPCVPVRAGEIACRLLGCAVEAFGPDGTIVPAGTTGELVITRPMPSMPVGFWGDDDGSRYRAAYFEDFPGVWRHGDWITFTDDGACTITGPLRRHPQPRRRAPRHERLLRRRRGLPEVADSLVVHLDGRIRGRRREGMGELILFVTLAPGAGPRRRAAPADRPRPSRSELSPRHAARPDRGRAGRPAHAVGQEARGPGQAGAVGDACRRGRSPGSLVDPEALRWFERYTQRSRPMDRP